MSSTSKWNRFFLDAKIPKDIAAKYAIRFQENRISFDMLMDLNKVKIDLHFFKGYFLIHDIPGISKRSGHHCSW